MKKMMKTLAVLSMIGTMAMTMGITASADDTPNGDTPATVEISRDKTSGFTYDGNTVNAGIESFELIKDYDSVNPTDNAPNSNSPADTFKYTITPYAVWNAGSTYDKYNTATNITVDNMPMLYATDPIAPNGTLVIEQRVAINAAKYSETASETHTAENTVDASATINLPTYETVGDYWYEVKETIGNTTGVFYGTNDSKTDTPTASNGTHDATYYIHVQVTETATGSHNSDSQNYDSVLVQSVTMHTTAPAKNLSDAQYNTSDDGSKKYYVSANKVNAIENKYYAGDLVIKKEVTGNAGDKDEYFEVTVTFTKPEGTIVNSDIPFTAFLKTTENNVDTYASTSCKINGQYAPSTDNNNQTLKSASNIFWNKGENNTDEATATVTFYVKDGDSVTFSNIPYGIKYSVAETLPANDTYTNKIEFTASGDSATSFDGVSLEADTDAVVDGNKIAGNATGSISDANDTITITNDKVNSIDIGVILSNAPFIAMLGIAGAASYFVLRRKKRIEE